MKNWCSDASFQYTTFKTLHPRKISIFKIVFDAVIILLTKKDPELLTRYGDYFMFELLRPCRKPMEQFWKQIGLFHQYSWNSEVETRWISLIRWPLRTSNTYVLCKLWDRKASNEARPPFSNTLGKPLTSITMHCGQMIWK